MRKEHGLYQGNGSGSGKQQQQHTATTTLIYLKVLSVAPSQLLSAPSPGSSCKAQVWAGCQCQSCLSILETSNLGLDCLQISTSETLLLPPPPFPKPSYVHLMASGSRLLFICPLPAQAALS